MTQFVRVRLENGSEASVSVEHAKRVGLTPLEKPAARGGKALPAKHNPFTKPVPVPAPADHTEENKK